MCTFLPGLTPLRALCLSLRPEGPAPCSHQGSGALCCPPHPCPLPGPRLPPPSASRTPLRSLCPHFRPSSSACSPKGAWLCFLAPSSCAPQPELSTGTQPRCPESAQGCPRQRGCPGPPHLGPLLAHPGLVHLGLPFLFFFCVACEILLPQSRIEPAPPALEAWSVSHWTTRRTFSKLTNPSPGCRHCSGTHLGGAVETP